MATKGARVHVYGDWDGSGVKKAQQDLSVFEKNAAGFSGAFSKSMLGVGAALGGAFSIGAIADFIRDATTAAIEDEKSMVALATAMNNVGLAGENPGVEAFIKKLSMATGIADDDLRPAMQRLITATGDAAKSQKLLTLALDISAATGKDVVSVSQAIARASTGQVSALTRLGVPLDANIVKSKDFGAAVDVLTQKFGGQAAAAADTYGGKLARLQVAADEAKESIGLGLLRAADELAAAMGANQGALDTMSQWASDFALGIAGLAVGYGDFIDEITIGAINVQDALGLLGDAEAESMREIIEAHKAARQERLKSYATGATAATAAATAIEDAANAEKMAIDAVTDSVKAFTDAISKSQNLDDFKKSLADLDKTLDGNKRTFKGMGDAAKENRDTLRTAFSDAAQIAEQWAKDNGASAAETKAYYDGLAGDIVDEFVDNGFKRSDVKKFLGEEGIWTGPAKDALDATERAGLKRAYGAGKAIGRDVATGVAAGVDQNTGVVTTAVAAMARAAQNKAEAALGIASPSKVFMEIGRQTIAGFVEGMASKDADVREQARKSMTEAVRQVIDDTRTQLKTALADAKAAFNDFKQGVSSAIMGGLDFGAAAPEFDEAGNRVGSTFIEALRQQAAQAMTFATQVKTLIQQGLSRDALTQVLSAGVAAGSAIATELINGGTTAITETNNLVASTQAAADKVGLQAATKWYGAGVESARQTVQAFNDEMKPGGDGYERLMKRMDRLAEDMNRTARITVVVDEVAGAKVKVDGARAKGGPVWPGGAFIVGERGPELFMPQVNGTILPSASMPSASGGASISGGNSYSITVQAGVGDPRQIGQQVVEYIKRYESANGRVFAAA